MKTAVVYDFLQVRGGAERLSRLMARRMPADLYVHSASRDELEQSATPFLSLTGNPTSTSSVRRALSAWRGFEFMAKRSGYSHVVFSGHYAPMAWHAFPGASRLLYLHAPPLPFVLDPNDESRSDMSLVKRLAALPAMNLLLERYRRAAGKMHAVVANSRFVADAFQRLTGRQPTVVHPPVRDGFFREADNDVSGGYWLSWARHEPVKRIDRIIEAFLQMPEQRLVIAGAGGCTSSLRAQAEGAGNIQFIGELDREELLQWIRPALGAVHFSRSEPYGLAIAEAVAAGKFVIAPDEGGVRDIVEQGVSGALLDSDPSPSQLIASVREWAWRIEQGLWRPSAASQVNCAADFLAALQREFVAVSGKNGERQS